MPRPRDRLLKRFDTIIPGVSTGNKYISQPLTGIKLSVSGTTSSSLSLNQWNRNTNTIVIYTGTGSLDCELSIIAGNGNNSLYSQLTKLSIEGLSRPVKNSFTSYPKERDTTHTGTGVLESTISIISATGTAITVIEGSGVLISDPSTITNSTSESANTWHNNKWWKRETHNNYWFGTAEIIVNGIGILIPELSLISGISNLNIKNGVGNLVPTLSTVNASGKIIGSIGGSGIVSSEISTISGSGNKLSNITGIAEFISNNSELNGIGEIFERKYGDGNITSLNSIVSGTGTLRQIHIGTGDLISEFSTVYGIKVEVVEVFEFNLPITREITL